MRRPLLALASLMLVAAACSLPNDESAQIIDQERLDGALQRVTTTTSSTTLPPPLTVDFAYYLLVDTEEGRKLQQVVVAIPESQSISVTIAAMAVEGFPESIGADPDVTINRVRLYEVESVTFTPEASTATVALTIDPEVEPPDNSQLVDVAAQLVWTLTGVDGIELIEFVIDGETQDIPTQEGQTDELLSRDDYRIYDAEAPDEPPDETTSTTSTTTTTTVPPDE
ncbi:MAG: GerMN domain-containing protein [Acidimicrobiales bacterium]|nr:GerMN domain-containing protein [Acidimicrobiales bacterium]